MPHNRAATLLAVLMSVNTSAGACLASERPMAKGPLYIAQASGEALRFYNAGIGLMNAKKYTEAQESFQRAVDIDPTIAFAHWNLGVVLTQQNKYQDALPELRRAVELNPRLAGAWNSLGVCLVGLSKFTEAIAAFNKYLQLEPNGQFAPNLRKTIVNLQAEAKRFSNRPGAADDYYSESVAGKSGHWTSMPVVVYITPANGIRGFRNEFVDILKAAITDWQQESNGLVSFTYTQNPGQANVVCSFTDSHKDALSIAEGGHCIVTHDDTGKIVHATVTILTVELSGAGQTDNTLRRIALHEVGHALGLAHSRDSHDVMFMASLSGVERPSLSAHDAKTIQRYYNGGNVVENKSASTEIERPSTYAVVSPVEGTALTPQQPVMVQQQPVVAAPETVATQPAVAVPMQPVIYAPQQQSIVAPQIVVAAPLQPVIASPQQPAMTAPETFVPLRPTISAPQQPVALAPQTVAAAPLQPFVPVAQPVVSAPPQSAIPAAQQAIESTQDKPWVTPGQLLSPAPQPVMTYSQQPLASPAQPTVVSPPRLPWMKPAEQTGLAPQQFAAAPQQSLAPASQQFAPQQFAAAPQQVAPAPQQPASAPQQLASAPQQISSAPQQLASAPQQIAAAPQQVASAPQQPSAAPSANIVSNDQPVLQAFASNQGGMVSQARQLSDQALRLFNSGLSEAAIAMFEEAHTLAPDDAAVAANVGASYAIMGGNAVEHQDYNLANTYYQKAIPLMERLPNANLKIALKRYSQMLRLANRNDDAQTVEAKLSALGAK